MNAEDRTSKPVRAASFAVVAVAVVVLLVMFVLPGFLAAGLSRCRLVLSGNYYEWVFQRPTAAAPVLVVLVPASWLMKHSERARLFYMWEYRIGGGENWEIGPIDHIQYRAP
ncbi:MAG TPA: hypothetical protein VG733_04040 [Chthoniobacteraceae bacterium]|nr:hypothetical protein [Chthoniobacteraceae bacterium]